MGLPLFSPLLLFAPSYDRAHGPGLHIIMSLFTSARDYCVYKAIWPKAIYQHYKMTVENIPAKMLNIHFMVFQHQHF